MAPAALRPDFSRSSVSRYIQLAGVFRRQIETGAWPLGSQIPTVEELAEECGVAPATIRQALSQLSNEGLIERFRAKGTFVSRSVQNEIWCSIATDWSGMLNPSSDDATIEVLSRSRRSLPLPVSHELGTTQGHYRHVRRRHWRQDRPFLVADVYLAEVLHKHVTIKDLRNKTAMRIASDLLGSTLKDASHTITVASADTLTAQLLSIPVNSPVVHVRREVIDRSDQLMVVSDGVYRGDVVKMNLRLLSGAA